MALSSSFRNLEFPLIDGERSNSAKKNAGGCDIAMRSTFVMHTGKSLQELVSDKSNFLRAAAVVLDGNGDRVDGETR